MESVGRCVFFYDRAWTRLSNNNNYNNVINLSTRTVIAYCRSLHRSVSQYFSLVLTADIFEEEDFQASYRNVLCQSFPVSEDEEVQRLVLELENHSELVDLLNLLKSRLASEELVSMLEELVLRLVRRKSEELGDVGIDLVKLGEVGRRGRDCWTCFAESVEVKGEEDQWFPKELVKVIIIIIVIVIFFIIVAVIIIFIVINIIFVIIVINVVIVVIVIIVTVIIVVAVWMLLLFLSLLLIDIIITVILVV